jgi:hypothetical protein
MLAMDLADLWGIADQTNQNWGFLQLSSVKVRFTLFRNYISCHGYMPPQKKKKKKKWTPTGFVNSIQCQFSLAIHILLVVAAMDVMSHALLHFL